MGVLKDFKPEYKVLNENMDGSIIMLEYINKKVEIVAEVQAAHKEQGKRRLEKVL